MRRRPHGPLILNSMSVSASLELPLASPFPGYRSLPDELLSERIEGVLQLGATKAVAFDISAACSGFLYAMKISKRLISDGAFANALIIGAEKLSSVTNWTDRSTCVLFGDGAGAAVLRRAEPGEGCILATEMGTDGSLTHLLEIPGGGTACPITSANVNDNLQTLSMLGKEVFKHAVNRMKEAAIKVIERSGLQPEDIVCVIPHQANLRIIDAIADRLECLGVRHDRAGRMQRHAHAATAGGTYVCGKPLDDLVDLCARLPGRLQLDLDRCCDGLRGAGCQREGNRGCHRDEPAEPASG